VPLRPDFEAWVSTHRDRWRGCRCSRSHAAEERMKRLPADTWPAGAAVSARGV
jgi:hypothetical protein